MWRRRIGLVLALVTFWSLVAVVYLSENALAQYLQQKNLGTAALLLSSVGWFLWIPFTWLVWRLALRFPVERKNFVRRSLLHLLLSFAIAIFHFLIDLSCCYVLWIILVHPVPPVVWLMSGLITYRFHANLLIYIGIVGFTQATSYYRKLKDLEINSARMEAQLAQTELQFLRLQLHPHFLFNTHHAIIGLILRNQNEEAAQMLTKLSELLRMILENTSQEEVPLERELDFINRYLEIQKLRFPGRLDLIAQASPEVLNSHIPTLLLQPIVENAVKYALGEQSNGKIEITANRAAKNLKITIRDHGKGLPSGELKEGIGIRNTRLRLQQMYGPHQNFEIKTHTLGGTLVEITLPFRP